MTNRVAEVRKAKSLSQQELADRAGISRTYLSIIETTPDKVLSNDVMFRIARVLDVGIEHIFLP